MSGRFAPNPDAERGSYTEGSAGPLMGFMDAFDAAWTSQTRNHSLLAVEQSMRTIEQEQIKRMREAGLRPPKSLDDSEDDYIGGPLGMAQFKKGRYSAAAQSIIDGGGWYTDELVAERDKEIETAKKLRPDLGLMTYAEMFGKVREQAQEIEQKAQGPTSAAGTVGGFLGSMVGAMDPRSDPANFASMFLNAGSGPAARVAYQGLANAGVEAGTMAVSDPENILLGKQRTFGEDVQRLGFAAVGGASGQVLGEAIGAGVRRLRTGKWFADVPPPEPPPAGRPAPTPEPIGAVAPEMPRGRPFMDYPDWESFARAHNYDFETTYGKTRDAKLRSALDLDHVASQLDRWDGPLPHEVPPSRTDTRFVTDVEPGVRYERPYQRYIDSMDTVDDIARRIDPDLFRQYDKLVEQRNRMREDIAAEQQRFKDFKGPDTMFEANEAARRAAEIEQRMSLQKIDEQMRDLAPLVTRAYAAAEKEWRSTPMDWNTLRFLKDLEDRSGFNFRGEGKSSLSEQPAKIPAKETAPVQNVTVGDAVPLAKLTPELEARVKLDANADAPTRVAAAVKEELTAMDEKVDAFLKSSKAVTKFNDAELKAEIANIEKRIKAVDPKAENADETLKKLQADLDALLYVTLPDGTKLHMTKDKVPYVDADGTEKQMSVREFMREMEKDQQALQSVTTCSRPS